MLLYNNTSLRKVHSRYSARGNVRTAVAAVLQPELAHAGQFDATGLPQPFFFPLIFCIDNGLLYRAAPPIS